MRRGTPIVMRGDGTAMLKRVLIGAAAAAPVALAAGLVSAPAASANHILTLTVTKTAGGTVTSDDTPREIDCGTDCGGTYEHDRLCEPPPDQHLCDDFYRDATLTATPAPGYRFTGWPGDCTNATGPCQLSMTDDRAVTATFVNSPPTLTVQEPTARRWTNGSIFVRATVTDDLDRITPFTHLAQRDSFGTLQPFIAVDPMSPDFGSSSSYSGVLGARSQMEMWPFAILPDGPEAGQVTVSACDAASACTDRQVTVGIDRVNPTLNQTSSGPSGTVGAGTQVWRFEAGDALSGLETGFPQCLESGGPVQACATNPTSGWEIRRTYTTSGTHTWSVRARDRAGNIRDMSRTFTVDADAPETSIDSGPADGSSSPSSTATFAFSSPEAGAAFRCRIYSTNTAPATFGDCSGPDASHTTTGIPPGTYRFEVAARDAHGNADPTPAGRTFTVQGPDGGGSSTGDGSSTGGGATPGNTDTGGSGQPGTGGQLPDQQTGTQGTPRAPARPGKCAKLEGRKRAACVKKACGKFKRSKKTAKKYRACVKAATRRA